MKSKLLAPALAIAAMLLGLAAASFWLAPQDSPIQTGTLLPQPRQLNDFNLIGDDGQPFTRERLQGRWSIVFPGFTHCPDICPTTLAMLKAVNDRLAASGGAINVLFLSVDPQRDGPVQLASYVRHFHAQFLGATAQEPELARFTRELGIAYAQVPGSTPQTYTMDHSASLVLLNPQVQVAAYFTPPFSVDTLAADLLKLIRS